MIQKVTLDKLLSDLQYIQEYRQREKVYQDCFNDIKQSILHELIFRYPTLKHGSKVYLKRYIGHRMVSSDTSRLLEGIEKFIEELGMYKYLVEYDNNTNCIEVQLVTN